MERILVQFLERSSLPSFSSSSSSFSSSSLSPPPPSTIVQPPQGGFSLDSKISPSILLIIVILAIIFFVSGLLHLLVRFLLRPNSRDPDELDSVTALQGQLQQLFHLHDAGVDQSFIDTLPVFLYKAIIGVKDPFDCAVCLCEFEPVDKLRLLPKCSHAFHMECIDTWLLSHSTCPLCRASLLPDFSPHNSFTPIVCVLESGSDSSREIGADRDGALGRSNSMLGSNSHLGFPREGESGSSRIDCPRKSLEISEKDEVFSAGGVAVGNSGEKIVTVKLGKFRSLDASGEGSSENNNNHSNGNNMSNSRRCYSMGSFAYVMDGNPSLQVPIRTPAKKSSTKKPRFLPLKPGHRSSISEYGSDSRREFNGLEAFKCIKIHESGNGGSSSSNPRSKSERFSISKIWLRGEKKDKGDGDGANANGDSSKRAFSFRFPIRQSGGGNDVGGGGGGGGNVSRRTISEIEIDDGWENGGSEMGWEDEETHSCYSVDSQAIPSSSSSTARRTLLWIMGRQQNKVVHSSISSSNV